MAYVIGFISDEEREDLESRGWEFEDPPAGLAPENTEEGFVKWRETHSYKMAWIDSSLYEIMTGPDWEPRPEATVDEEVEKNK